MTNHELAKKGGDKREERSPVSRRLNCVHHDHLCFLVGGKLHFFSAAAFFSRPSHSFTGRLRAIAAPGLPWVAVILHSRSKP